MAYIQRWEKDLSGKGGQYVYDDWPSSDDNDCFFLLTPFVRIAKRMLRISVLKAIIGVLWNVIRFLFKTIVYICTHLYHLAFRYWRKENVDVSEGTGRKAKREHYKEYGDT